MKSKKVKPIKSSQAAALEAAALSVGNSYYGVSRESNLRLRTLIYCAVLLEQILRQRSPKKKTRSKWQAFLSSEMKAGATIQEAARKWKTKR